MQLLALLLAPVFRASVFFSYTRSVWLGTELAGLVIAAVSLCGRVRSVVLGGAMLGGLLIGLIEAFWSGYFSIEYKDVAVYSILILVLVSRPTGLLGRPEVEKV